MPDGMLVDTRNPNNLLPYQVVDRVLHFAHPCLPAGRKVEFQFRGDKRTPSRLGSAEVVDRNGCLDMLLKRKLFTTYAYQPVNASKPYFYPVIGPRGIPVTRGWPMDPQKGDDQDHVHHKSLWVAHGDVNGADLWGEEAGHGYQEHKEFTRLLSGPFVGGFDERLVWLDKEHRPLLAEHRSARFYNLPANLRVMDLSVKFIAEHGPVAFGDTKEGGIVSLRVSSRMDGKQTGLIQNAFGGKGEAETWGKPSPWVDYSGLLRGKRIGIAIFDHRDNLRHPARWHVRDYGLFALNPFALSHYRYGRDANGAFFLEAGKELHFQFRILIHQNDAVKGKVADRYLSYAFPPKVEILTGKTGT